MHPTELMMELSHALTARDRDSHDEPLPGANPDLKPGQRVKHLGHGPGVIEGYNQSTGLYGGIRYPYIVKFEPREKYPKGYRDVYARCDLTPIE